MKICLVHEEYPEETNFGGIATYQKVIAEEYARMGHEVYVICRGLSKDQSYIENGVNITRIFVEKTDNQILDYTEYRKRVAELLFEMQRDNKIDIIEVPDWGAETVLFEPQRRVPLVVRLHTPLKIWLKYNKNDFGDVTQTMLQWEEKMINSADLITCCSNALKKMIIEDFNIAANEIIVTPNPSNNKNFYRDDSIDVEDSVVFVGSLEERKGVIVFAHALNEIFQKYPDVKIKFIGKDTIRNNKNISTQKYILSLVDENYRDNVLFLGQLKNENINYYLNSSRVAVFPSLFDNFPYVVLESMLTGVHIVGSKNSGMVEMLDDDSSIYETGDSKDLAKLVIDKYEQSFIEQKSSKNIERAKSFYSAPIVCKKMIEMYSTTINEYSSMKTNPTKLEEILKEANCESDIVSFSIEEGGVANIVYKVITASHIYIIKKYLYKYDFELADKLYKKYKDNGIDIVKPINEKPINSEGYIYNVFEYKEPDEVRNVLPIDFWFKIIDVNRAINSNSIIIEKMNKYYNELNNENNEKFQTEISFVCSRFQEIICNKIFEEKFLNHGDLSKENVVISKEIPFLIDFDETTIAPFLYDFAVIVIKQFTNHGKLDYDKYNQLMKMIISNHSEYNEKDFMIMVEFYLIKILMEKFYFYKIGKINLYSPRQQKDNYIKYYKLLHSIIEDKDHILKGEK